MNTIRGRGAIPLLDWSSCNQSLGGSLTQPTFSLANIINGVHDAFITQWATDAKAWGFPFFLRLDWEMNGNWFVWSEKVNGNSAGQYVAAWRRVHDIFTSVGANNVTWVWCPNIDSSTMIPMASLYPDDAYVDWTGIDGYNKYSTWLAFNQVFAATGINWLYDSYHELLSLAPSKPIMVAEFASLEAGDGGAKKAAWVTHALTAQIPANFPAIKAIVWFNWNMSNAPTLIIESSPRHRAPSPPASPRPSFRRTISRTYPPAPKWRRSIRQSQPIPQQPLGPQQFCPRRPRRLRPPPAALRLSRPQL